MDAHTPLATDTVAEVAESTIPVDTSFPPNTVIRNSPPGSLADWIEATFEQEAALQLVRDPNHRATPLQQSLDFDIVYQDDGNEAQFRRSIQHNIPAGYAVTEEAYKLLFQVAHALMRSLPMPPPSASMTVTFQPPPPTTINTASNDAAAADAQTPGGPIRTGASKRKNSTPQRKNN
jgi:hypothetical protein